MAQRSLLISIYKSTYLGPFLQIITWMETCLISTHTTSDIYIYIYNIVKNAIRVNKREWGMQCMTLTKNATYFNCKPELL